MKFYTPKIVGSLCVVFILITTIALFAIQALESSAKKAVASRTANILSATINEVRISYSSKVISKVKASTSLSVEADYHSKLSTIPNPNTFAIELGEAVSEPNKGFIITIFSEYPFVNRLNTGGVRDKFQKDALKNLNTDNKTYERVGKAGEIQVLRHATAIFMEQSCVNCHNSHQDSSKKDWKVGDLRGAINITIPLNQENGGLVESISYIYLFFSLFSVFGLVIMSYIVNRMWKSSKELETEYKHKTSSLTKLAKIDSLTSIANRRYFDEYCKELFSVKVNNEINVALIAYDLDHFKKINDSYGHSVGDLCLVAATKAVGATIRTENSFHARTGGEEFVIVLKKVQEGDIDRIVSRIMNSMRNVKIPSHEKIKLTCSVGSTNIERVSGVNYLRMLEVADEAMYEAKENGRDCWVHKKYEI